MEDHLSVYRKRREREQDYKELAAKSCYSVIIIIAALVFLRPLMVGQILSRAAAYSNAGLLVEARRQCDKALLIDGESSEAWYEMGRFYRAEGNRDMAYGAFQKAVQADLLHRPAQFELGTMYVEDNRYQLAIPHLDKVRSLGPKKPGAEPGQGPCNHQAALDLLVRCYEEVGDLAKAEFTLEEIRVYYPGACDADARLERLKKRQPNR